MRNNQLGRTGVLVSELGLGTVTFGAQVDEASSFQILNAAHDGGITLIDTSEAYPTPPSFSTAGLTETIVGRWLRTKNRESIVISSKVCGPGHGWLSPPVRNGMTTLDRTQITRAVENSLRRLDTDYIDLYQIHWPDHGTPYEPVLDVLTGLVREGKVRVIGCCNETSWGLMKSLWVAEKSRLNRFESVQHGVSLLNRRCEDELAQVCRREQVSLLAYSPLGGGVLSGKYNCSSLPEGARFTRQLKQSDEAERRRTHRYVNDKTLAIAERVSDVARESGLDLATLAIAWTKQQDFVTSTIFGASRLEQLKEPMKAVETRLDDELMTKIDQIYAEFPRPMPEDGLRRH